MQRHIVTICRIEVLALLVDAAECGGSCTRKIDKSLWGCKRFENKSGWSGNLHAALRVLYLKVGLRAKAADETRSNCEYCPKQ